MKEHIWFGVKGRDEDIEELSGKSIIIGGIILGITLILLVACSYLACRDIWIRLKNSITDALRRNQRRNNVIGPVPEQTSDSR